MKLDFDFLCKFHRLDFKVMVSQQCVFSYECSMAVLIWRLYSTICIYTSSSYDDTHCWEAITLKRTFQQIFFLAQVACLFLWRVGAILQKFRNVLASCQSAKFYVQNIIILLNVRSKIKEVWLLLLYGYQSINRSVVWGANIWPAVV